MFNKTLTYTNTTGSWTNIAEAVTQINAGVAAAQADEDKIKIDELSTSNDMSWNEPTMSADSTTVTYIVTASQAALDVFDAMSETSGFMPEGSTITKTFSEWTPAG